MNNFFKFGRERILLLIYLSSFFLFILPMVSSLEVGFCNPILPGGQNCPTAGANATYNQNINYNNISNYYNITNISSTTNLVNGSTNHTNLTDVWGVDAGVPAYHLNQTIWEKIASDIYSWLTSALLNADNNDGWLYDNGTDVFFNTTKLATIYYNATQSENVTGTIDGGDLANTQHPDGDYDGETFNFTERVSAPALDLRINFTGVESFNKGIIRYKTSTLVGEKPIIQVWNYNTDAWEGYDVLAESPLTDGTRAFVTIAKEVFDNVEHVENNVVQMRILKGSTGNINNHYYVDWIAIASGYATPIGEEVDPYSYHTDEDINATGFNITGDILTTNFNLICNDTVCFTLTELNATGTSSGSYNETYDTWLGNYTEFSPYWYNHTSAIEGLYGQWFYNMTVGGGDSLWQTDGTILTPLGAETDLTMTGTITGGTISDGVGASMTGGTVTASSLTDGAGTTITGGGITTNSVSDGTASWTSNSLSGFSSISGTTLTDGTCSITGGGISSCTSISGTTLTDGVASISSGAGTGFTSITSASLDDGAGSTISGGTVNATYFSDGTCSITGGVLSGCSGITAVEVDTLQNVTDRGYYTTNPIWVGTANDLSESYGGLLQVAVPSGSGTENHLAFYTANGTALRSEFTLSSIYSPEETQGSWTSNFLSFATHTPDYGNDYYGGDGINDGGLAIFWAQGTEQTKLIMGSYNEVNTSFMAGNAERMLFEDSFMNTYFMNSYLDDVNGINSNQYDLQGIGTIADSSGFYAMDNTAGADDASSWQVCTSTTAYYVSSDGVNLDTQVDICTSWCTLDIRDGLVTGCA